MLPTSLAVPTEKPAVIFRISGGNADGQTCLRSENPTSISVPDDGCYRLTSNYIEVWQIAETYRGTCIIYAYAA
jgi:hypothetical protein